jgi:hypothetical protein
MPSLPKLFSLVILALVLFGGLRPEMGVGVVLGLLGLAAALDAGAGLRAGGAASAWLWCGHQVKVVDGTSFSMPDTAANQRQ